MNLTKMAGTSLRYNYARLSLARCRNQNSSLRLAGWLAEWFSVHREVGGETNHDDIVTLASRSRMRVTRVTVLKNNRGVARAVKQYITVFPFIGRAVRIRHNFS
jgi:hypothetical protein